MEKFEGEYIFCLDDNGDDLILLSNYLKKHLPKMSVEVFTDWDVLQERIEAQTPFCIITDYNMGPTKALDVIQFAVNRTESIPIIVVSGELGSQRAVEIMKEGATDFITKDNLQRLKPALFQVGKLWEERLDRQRAQNKEKQTAKLFDRLISRVQDAILGIDNNKCVVYLNHTASKLTGVSSKDALGKSYKEVFPDLNLNPNGQGETLIEKALRTQQIQSNLVTYAYNGEKYQFSAKAFPDEMGVTLVGRDLTKQMRQVKEVLKLKKLFEISNHALHLNIWEWNFEEDSFDRFFGPQSVFDKNGLEKPSTLNDWLRVIVPEDRARLNKQLRRAANKKESFTLDYKLDPNLNEGKEAFFRLRAEPMKNDEGTITSFAGIAWETTRIIKQLDRVIQQNTAFKQMAWEQSHLIRAPLSNIMGMIDMLDDNVCDWKELAEKMRLTTNTLDKVVTQSVRKAESIITDSTNFIRYSGN